MDLYGLYSENCERCWNTKNEIPNRIRNVSEADDPEDCDHQVSDTCHDLSTVAFTHLRTILIKGHIAHIVHSVFDLPVSSI